MKTSAFVACGLLAISSLAGCSDQADTTEFTNSPETPNPSAVFCTQQGGEYRLGSGQCKLPDGKSVDAWDYFRSEHPDQDAHE